MEQVKKTKAILFLINPNDRDTFEMKSLIDTAGYEIVFIDKQNIQEINKSFYMGSGKIEELDASLKLLDGFDKTNSVLIINVDLNQTQLRNIHELLDITIIDRTSLILEIFESNAKTQEAKAQVMIAKLEHLSAQLVDEKANYAQVTSGRGHNKGSGETQKELSRREISLAIRHLNKQLEKIRLARQNSRKKRLSSSLINISIVGYTNAGKSTLLNSLVSFSKRKPEKSVYAEDKLFATLETQSRLIDVYGYPSFIITDTVGFIDRLPHFLVKAFMSTLETIKDSDYIIEVVDSSSPHSTEERRTTEEVLDELGCHDIPKIVIYNKMDLVKYPSNLLLDNEIHTSLHNLDNIKDVFNFILMNITKEWDEKEIFVPYEYDLRIFSKENFILNKKEEKDGYTLTVRFNPRFINKYNNYFSN